MAKTRLEILRGYKQITLLATLTTIACLVISVQSATAAESPDSLVPMTVPGIVDAEQVQLPLPPPSRAGGATVARVVRASMALQRLEKGSKKIRVAALTAWSRQTQQLLALESANYDGKEWVRVRLAERPNGSSAWVERNYVVLTHVPYWIQVSLRSKSVRLFRDGKQVLKTRAVIGARKTPTPRGLAAIYERNHQSNSKGFVGPWVLSMTVHSKVLQEFDGGPGRVAIHGRAGASLADPLGTARSHGCVRIGNRVISRIAKLVPNGTPVLIGR